MTDSEAEDKAQKMLAIDLPEKLLGKKAAYSMKSLIAMELQDAYKMGRKALEVECGRLQRMASARGEMVERQKAIADSWVENDDFDPFEDINKLLNELGA
jgi:hypothetical protein